MTHRVEDVFVTEGVPKHTFIKPPNFANILVDLRAPKKPIVFEGASGTGKTTSIIEGLKQAGITNYKLLSARLPNDIKDIKQLVETGRLPAETTIIDDFHRLSESDRTVISDLVRAGADNPAAIGGKLIIAGINKAGEQLIKASEDLLKRIGIYKIPPADPDDALATMRQGCTLLGISISNLEQLVAEARGDYWTLQKKCQVSCIENKIFETQASQVTIAPDLQHLVHVIMDQLGTLYYEVLRDFVKGSRFRKTNRPYLKLLELFSQIGQSSVSLNDLAHKYPEEKTRLDLIKKTRLPKLLSSKKGLSEKFYYDKVTTIFSVEDPGLAFYIRNVNWEKFASDIGFPKEDHDWQYEIGISFAGEQRSLAKSLADKFEANDVSVFYDEYADLIGRDLEDELSSVYGEMTRFIVVLISNEYVRKTWPAFERAVWATRVKDGRIIPIFIDDVILKEVSTSIGRIDFRAVRQLLDGKINQSEYDDHLEILYSRCNAVLEDR